MAPTIETITAVHPEIARALRAQTGMDRLRLAHETWELVRDRLAAFLDATHPSWSREEILRAVARRLLDDSGRAAAARTDRAVGSGSQAG